MRQRRTAPGGFRGKTSSAIFGHPDIPCFLLLDDPANELFLSVGLGTDSILTPVFSQTTDYLQEVAKNIRSSRGILT